MLYKFARNTFDRAATILPDLSCEGSVCTVERLRKPERPGSERPNGSSVVDGSEPDAVKTSDSRKHEGLKSHRPTTFTICVAPTKDHI